MRKDFEQGLRPTERNLTPYRRLPNSTPAVLRILKTAADTYHNTADPADRAIPADLWAQLDRVPAQRDRPDDR